MEADALHFEAQQLKPIRCNKRRRLLQKTFYNVVTYCERYCFDNGHVVREHDWFYQNLLTVKSQGPSRIYKQRHQVTPIQLPGGLDCSGKEPSGRRPRLLFTLIFCLSSKIIKQYMRITSFS